MPSLTDNIKELRARVKQGRELGYAGFEPIFYLVFPPHEILRVKRETPALEAGLRSDGWEVHRFSVADEIQSLLTYNPLFNIWLQADRQDPLNWDRTNKSLSNALMGANGLQKRFETLLAELEGKPQHLVLVTDLEALHPYLRIGGIEAGMHGKFHVPTIFLYPGDRVGKMGLKYLGFYREDGNYRSVHIG